MNKTTAILRLIRLPNLLIVALTQILFRYCVMLPAFDLAGVEPLLGSTQFFLLVIATVLIAMGGYIANDYFDVQVDRMNRPGKVVVDDIISKRSAFNLYTIVSVGGVVLSAVVALQLQQLNLATIFILAAALLWFYASSFKGFPLVGNLIVAFLSAITVVVVVLFERSIFGDFSDAAHARAANLILWHMLAYAIFAFLISMVRELVKDLQDYKGDDFYNVKTVPVAFGISATKGIATLFNLMLIAGLAYVTSLFGFETGLPKSLYACLMILLSLAVGALIFKAKEPKDYQLISWLLKGIMLLGVLSMLIFYWLAY